MEARSRTKNWCFTSFNVENEPFSTQRESIAYLIYGREVCPDTARQHLQGFVVFKNRKYFRAVKCMEPTFHIEVCRGTLQEAADYCKKDGEFIEFGEFPKLSNIHEQFTDARILAERGDFETLRSRHAGLYIRYKKNLDSLRKFNTSDLDNSCGVWIVGPPRCGKDYAVRNIGNVFAKPLNKWWDGYMGEENVLISDVEPDHGKWLGYFLKIWCDRYPFMAEIKGGTVKIRPKCVYVTSNFEMKYCFEGKVLEALQTRFDVLDFLSEQDKVKLRNASVINTRVLDCLLHYRDVALPETVALAEASTSEVLPEEEGYSSSEDFSSSKSKH